MLYIRYSVSTNFGGGGVNFSGVLVIRGLPFGGLYEGPCFWKLSSGRALNADWICKALSVEMQPQPQGPKYPVMGYVWFLY